MEAGYIEYKFEEPVLVLGKNVYGVLLKPDYFKRGDFDCINFVKKLHNKFKEEVAIFEEKNRNSNVVQEESSSEPEEMSYEERQDLHKELCKAVFILGCPETLDMIMKSIDACVPDKERIFKFDVKSKISIMLDEIPTATKKVGDYSVLDLNTYNNVKRDEFNEADREESKNISSLYQNIALAIFEKYQVYDGNF